MIGRFHNQNKKMHQRDPCPIFNESFQKGKFLSKGFPCLLGPHLKCWEKVSETGQWSQNQSI